MSLYNKLIPNVQLIQAKTMQVFSFNQNCLHTAEMLTTVGKPT